MDFNFGARKESVRMGRAEFESDLTDSTFKRVLSSSCRHAELCQYFTRVWARVGVVLMMTNQ